jgi:hypothetical protein
MRPKSTTKELRMDLKGTEPDQTEQRIPSTRIGALKTPWQVAPEDLF